MLYSIDIDNVVKTNVKSWIISIPTNPLSTEYLYWNISKILKPIPGSGSETLTLHIVLYAVVWTQEKEFLFFFWGKVVSKLTNAMDSQ
jgi:hypothetical protein